MTAVNGHAIEVGPLRQLLDETMQETGLRMKALTVLSGGVDPFRLDTPAKHRDGKWLADSIADLSVRHLRGMHYALIGRPKPDGSPYTNTESDWNWLGDAASAARWLNYIPFDMMVDRKHAAPSVREPQTSFSGEAFLSTGVHVDIPDDINARVWLDGFTAAQPYRFIMVAEKASADVVLEPLADRYGADLYLLTGNISDTLVYRMAKDAAEDGRPLRVFYFADCDPSGWNMPIEVSRKLQAFATLQFPDLDFEAHRVGLTPDQVRTLGLPSTPLKATEKRAGKWQAAMGVQQTELDALATLQPDVLDRIARDYIDPFFDRTLNRRRLQAEREWTERAQAIIDAAADTPEMEEVKQQAQDRLADLQREIEAINEALRLDPSGFDLPDRPEPPEAIVDHDAQPKGLVASTDPFNVQTLGLVVDKNYGTQP